MKTMRIRIRTRTGRNKRGVGKTKRKRENKVAKAITPAAPLREYLMKPATIRVIYSQLPELESR